MKTLGVKLFRGIVGGGEVPIGATVTSGLIMLIIVPGVVAGIVVLFAGIKRTGICKSVGNNVVSRTIPAPVVTSAISKLLFAVTFTPAPIMFTGPKQI